MTVQWPLVSALGVVLGSGYGMASDADAHGKGSGSLVGGAGPGGVRSSAASDAAPGGGAGVLSCCSVRPDDQRISGLARKRATPIHA